MAAAEEEAAAPGSRRYPQPSSSVFGVKSVVAVLVVAGLAVALPAGAEDGTPGFPRYTGPEFQALYDYAVDNVFADLEWPDGEGAVTGDPDLDSRIWDLALARGYQLRPSANGGLVTVDGVPMQQEAAEAWAGLKSEARAAGMTFIVSSAYRSPAAQRTQFLSKLGGTSDQDIDAALRWYSLPGTSKHHGGYALDFRYRNGTFGEFRTTPDYAWLSANNFAVPKKHGFVPSYPDDVDDQGPNPEPWEFVWVGVDLIRCGIPLDLEQSKYASGHRSWLGEETARCPGSVTVEDLDYMLKTWGAKLEAMLRV